MRPLHGEMLPVFCVAAGRADATTRISSSFAGSCCTTRRPCSPKRGPGTCWSNGSASTSKAIIAAGSTTTRPQVYREYSTDNCEYEDDWVYDHYFETSEQVEEYMEAVLGPTDGDIRSPRPAAAANSVTSIKIPF